MATPSSPITPNTPGVFPPDVLLTHGVPKRVSYVAYAFAGLFFGFTLPVIFVFIEPYIFAPANATIAYEQEYRCGFAAMADLFAFVTLLTSGSILGLVGGVALASVLNLTYATFGVRKFG